MNNIIVVLIISFTKLLSLLPRSFFFVSNSKVWNTLSTPLKKRRKIIEANINYCFDDKPQEWRQADFGWAVFLLDWKFQNSSA